MFRKSSRKQVTVDERSSFYQMVTQYTDREHTQWSKSLVLLNIEKKYNKRVDDKPSYLFSQDCYSAHTYLRMSAKECGITHVGVRSAAPRISKPINGRCCYRTSTSNAYNILPREYYERPRLKARSQDAWLCGF